MWTIYSDGDEDREGYKLVFASNLQKIQLFEQKPVRVALSLLLLPSLTTPPASHPGLVIPPSLDLDVKSTVWGTDVNFCKP